jgi:hypothetical protein
MTGTYLYAFVTVFCLIFLRIRYISNKICAENQNIHFVFNNPFSKIVKFRRYCKEICQAPDNNMTRRMGFACRITKATDTTTQNV